MDAEGLIYLTFTSQYHIYLNSIQEGKKEVTMFTHVNIL